MKATRVVAILVLSAIIYSSLGISSFATPIDEKKIKISNVEKTIDKWNTKLEIAVEDYNQSQSDLGAVKKKLQKNQTKLDETSLNLKLKQKTLSKRARAIYKQGPWSYIYLIIQTSNVRDIVNNIVFVRKIISSDKKLVKEVKNTQNKLESINEKLGVKKNEKEMLLNKVAAKKMDVQDAVAAKNRILNSLKGQLKKLQDEEKERIRKIREEALRKIKEQQEQQKKLNEEQGRPSYSGSSTSTSNIIEIAKKYLGVRYAWGGTSPEAGFDCSGFVGYAYRQVGVYLPRTSRQQYSYLAAKERLVSEKDLQPGDLVFYGQGRITDVKMYMGSGYIIGANGGQFTPGEVRILTLHYRPDYFGAGRP